MFRLEQVQTMRKSEERVARWKRARRARVLLWEAGGRIGRAMMKRRDVRETTFTDDRRDPKGPLAQYLSRMDPELLAPHSRQIAGVAELHRQRYFDVLGSGWVRVMHGIRCRGLGGSRYDMGRPLVAGGVNGYLLPFASGKIDGELFVQRCVDLANDDDLRFRMGSEGLKRARATFANDETVRMYFEVIDTLLQSRA